MAPLDAITTREAALKRLDEIRDEERCLKQFLNSTTPIHKLPVEILVHALFVVGFLPVGQWWKRSSHWLRLMLVCRHWRDAACATPALWRAVDVGPRSDWLKLCLLRSGNCAMDIAFRNSAFPLNGYKLLIPHSHRIRTLEILLSWLLSENAWLDNKNPLLDTLGKLLHEDFPVLKKIRFTLDWSSRDVAEVALMSEHYPSLQSLTLARMAVSSDLQLYAKLHTLYIQSCKCDFTFDHFLNILSAAENLRTLHLSRLLCHIPGANTRSVSRRKITLPHLSKLSLYDTPQRLSTLLSLLILPKVDHVNIHGSTSSLDDLTGAGPRGMFLNLLPSDPTHCLPPFHRRIVDATLDVHQRKWLTCEAQDADGEGDDCPTGTLELRTDTAHEFPFSAGLHDLTTLLRGQQLTELTVTAKHDSLTDPHPWIELFRAFPSLAALNIVSGSGLIINLWRGLHRASLSNGPGDTAGELACPDLHFINVRGGTLYATEELLAEISACLFARAERGTRLKELYFCEMYHRDQKEYCAMRERFISQLQTLVEDFAYEDKAVD